MLSVQGLNQYYGGSHILRDVSFEISAGKVTVLHEGRVLAEGPMDAIREDPRVIDVYLGR